MPIESAVYIDTLVATNPAQEDPVAEGDNHIRMIKQVLKSTFPGLGVFGGLSNALDPAQGDAYVAVKSALANTIARTQHQKNAEVVSVLDFGAVGDGVTDDTSKFTNASSAPAIFVPPGSYVVTSAITGNFYSVGAVTILGGGSVTIVDLSELADTPRFWDNSPTVTVGAGGQFATINAALTYLRSKYLPYTSPPTIATITLKTGFIMAEQVLVHGINMGWVMIQAEDPTVIIDTSVLVDNIQAIYGINAKPAFAAIQGGILPRIGCMFDLQRQITLDTDPDKYGMFVSGPGSGGHIMNSTRGFKNAPAYGIYANRHGMINAYGADVSGAGVYGVYANRATINCHNIIANNCGDSGIAAWYGARINAFGGFASNCTKHGVYAAYNSQIGFNEGTAGSNGQMGVYAFSGSTIDCESAVLNNNTLRNIYAQDASTINAKNATATGAGSRGVFAINSSRINAENVVCTGAVDYGIIASSGSNINAQAANARKGVSDDPTDIAITGGSYINANSSTGGLSATKNTVTLAGIIHKL